MGDKERVDGMKITKGSNMDWSDWLLVVFILIVSFLFLGLGVMVWKAVLGI